jgi:2-dehydropantoate 2-reductase
LEDRLSWLVFGAGALGTYIGGSLALHRQNVTFLEQPALAAQLSQLGLRLNILGNEHVLPHPSVYSDLSEALAHGPYDIAIFALKSYDTHSALDSLAPFSSSLPPFLSLQNGVENEPALQAVLGVNRVIAGIVTSAISRRALGDILLERLRGMGVAAGHPLSSKLVHAFTKSGLNAHLFSNPTDMKWSKMLTNLLANSSSAILDMTPAEVLSHPGLFQIEIAQLRETLAVMRAQGIHAIDLPGTPVRLLATIVLFLPPSLSRPLISRSAGRGRGMKMPSFHIDLHSGRGKSEVDYLNGAVVRFGERYHVPTPVNRWLNQTLLELTQDTLPLDEYYHQPEKLLNRLNSSQN